MKTLLKALVSLLLLFIVFRNINVPAVLKTLISSNPLLIVIGFLLQIASTCLAAFRWHLVMKKLCFEENSIFYLISYLKGTFFNQVMPSSIGGDAFRVIDLGSKGYSKLESFYGVAIDRGIGLASLLLLSLTTSIFSGYLFPAWLIKLVQLVTLGGLAGFTLLCFIHKFIFFAQIKIFKPIVGISQRIFSIHQEISTIIVHLCISVTVHILAVLSFWALALAIGMDTSLVTLLVAIPPIFLLTLFPISLAGWGVREGAMVGVLMLAGIVKSQILSLSVLYGLLLIATGIPGAYFWACHPKSIKGK